MILCKLYPKNTSIAGWAEKKGFHTAKASRPDSYRAANHILRLALEARIVLALRPPSFTKHEGTEWICLKDGSYATNHVS